MAPSAEFTNSPHVIKLIAESFHSIEQMPKDERENVMRVLRGWLLVNKFGVEGQPTLYSFYNYCIAECRLDDPYWIDQSCFKMADGSI